MKRILFTIGTLDGGGVARSLLSLLETIDRERYEVHLFEATHGVRSSQVPPGVHSIYNPIVSALVSGPRGLRFLLGHGHWLLAAGSCLRMAVGLADKAAAGRLLAWLMPRVCNQHFDLAVDYNGQHMLYYLCTKVSAANRATFFHNDYRQWARYESADRKFFARVDAIFSVSSLCVQSLKEVFPREAGKIALMENIVPLRTITRLSRRPISLPQKPGQLTLLSLGHVCHAKGSDIAIAAAHKLKDSGLDFQWLFVGDVSADSDYRGQIHRLELGDCVHLLGSKLNPYPYIARCDIFVQLSRFEGKSIALDEAKLLCKPIVVANFSTVADQFTNGVNADICTATADGAFKAIRHLATHPRLRAQYTAYLQAHTRDNSAEVSKIYRLIDP